MLTSNKSVLKSQQARAEIQQERIDFAARERAESASAYRLRRTAARVNLTTRSAQACRSVRGRQPLSRVNAPPGLNVSPVTRRRAVRTPNGGVAFRAQALTCRPATLPGLGWAARSFYAGSTTSTANFSRSSDSRSRRRAGSVRCCRSRSSCPAANPARAARLRGRRCSRGDHKGRHPRAVRARPRAGEDAATSGSNGLRFQMSCPDPYAGPLVIGICAALPESALRISSAGTPARPRARLTEHSCAESSRSPRATASTAEISAPCGERR